MTRPARSWKAKLAMIVAAGVIASHIMACVESPMSFSPTGALAFSVSDPSIAHDFTGRNTFRVMILEPDKTLREIDRSDTHILGGPVFSPDATEIAYLRIPMASIEEEQVVVFVEPVPDMEVASPETSADEDVQVVSPNTIEGEETTEPEIVADERSFDCPLDDWEDLPCAILEAQSGLLDALLEEIVFVQAELVFRDAVSGALVDTIAFAMPQPHENTAWIDNWLSKPIFHPDAPQVFLTAENFIYLLDLEERKARILGTALRAALSPNGRTLAALGPSGEVIALYATDASRVIHLWPAHQIEAYSDIHWVGDDQIIVVGIENGKTYLDTYDANGVPQASRMLVEESFDGRSFSLSPDGRFLALVTDEDVTFFSDKFIVLEQFEHEFAEDFFDAAVYTVDSQQVAFKHLVTEELGEDGPEVVRTDAIVFFTPEGRELFRVDIPPVPINLPVETDEEAEDDTVTGEPQQ